MHRITFPSMFAFFLSCLALSHLDTATRSALVYSPITMPTQQDLQQQLVCAIKSRSLRLVKACIAAGTQPVLFHGDGITPLRIAFNACVEDEEAFVEDKLNAQIYDFFCQHALPTTSVAIRNYYEETLFSTPDDLV